MFFDDPLPRHVRHLADQLRVHGAIWISTESAKGPDWKGLDWQRLVDAVKAELGEDVTAERFAEPKGYVGRQIEYAGFIWIGRPGTTYRAK